MELTLPQRLQQSVQGSFHKTALLQKRVRELNSAIVRALVRTTGRSHSEVNAELNRRAGLRRVTEATLKQLERRLEVGEAWLRSP